MKTRNSPLSSSSAHGNKNNNQQQSQQIRVISTNSMMRNHLKTQPSSTYGQSSTAPQPQPPSGKSQPSSSQGMKSPRIKSANYIHEKNQKKHSSSSFNKTKVDLDSYISTVLSQDKSQLILEGRLSKAGK
jgi:hypothetical protein